eukprot:9919841-Alexandrium_andersonii.AAC.1
MDRSSGTASPTRLLQHLWACFKQLPLRGGGITAHLGPLKKCLGRARRRRFFWMARARGGRGQEGVAWSC